MTPATQQPNLSVKIAVSVLIAFIIAFSMLFAFDFLYCQFKDDVSMKRVSDNLLTQDFYKQHFDVNKKKIFLLGSSHIFALNTTYISDFLSKNNQNYDVYNLGQNADSPSERLKTIDMVVSAKPDVIIYGISYRDFENTIPVSSILSVDNVPNLLPNPHQIFDNIVSSSGIFSKMSADFIQNPKYVTLASINFVTDVIAEKLGFSTENEQKFVPYHNTFFKIIDSNTVVNNYTQLRDMELSMNPPAGIKIDGNKNVIALKEIIQTLEKNKIRIIIFSTPQSRFYLDVVPTQEKDAYNSILDGISTEYGLKIYSLTDRYASLELWSDPNHIAVGPKTTIYSEDVSKIILQEIKQ